MQKITKKMAYNAEKVINKDVLESKSFYGISDRVVLENRIAPSRS